MWGLMGQEAKKAYKTRCEESIEAAILSVIEATLRHIAEEGDSHCPHSGRIGDIKRRCYQCWESLRKEAGL